MNIRPKNENIARLERRISEEFKKGKMQGWISGIPYEIAFWKSYYGRRKSFRQLMGWSQLDKECELDCFDAGAFISSIGDDARIADIGCALSYAFGNVFKGERCEVAYIDPLAGFYNRILRETGRDNLPAITFGMGESLTRHLPPESQHLIHIRNSLDHGALPMLTIWQALAVLQPNGVLYLNHKPNEAEHEGYRGFHQFNIDAREGSLIIWNLEERIDVGKELADVADVETQVTPEGRIVAIIRRKKNAPIPEGIDRLADRFTELMQQELMFARHSFGKSFYYQTKYLFCLLSHKTMRLIPTSLVGRLKRLLAR